MKSRTFHIGVPIIFSMLMIGSSVFADPTWIGSGTLTDPYQIDDPNELVYLGEHPEYYSDNFILTADIDLAGRTFTQAVIAPAAMEFDSTFDGNHHKILNMTIDAQSSNANNLGLFGTTTSNAVIRNLGLEHVEITGGSSSNMIGAMVGYYEGDIYNCYATGTITSGNGYNIGGFVGACLSHITNCYADVDITCGGSSQRIGGFVGITPGTFLNCYAAGSVSGGSNVYGFRGYSFSTYGFLGCYHLHPDDGGGPVDSYVTVLTDEQMRDSGSFDGWDFFGETANGIKEIWKMDGYPVLSWQVPVRLNEFALLGHYWKESGFTQAQPQARVDWYTDGSVDVNDLALLSAGWLGRAVEKQYPLAPGDDFETGDFTHQPWYLGGDAEWVIDDVTVQQGSYSARSGAIGDSQSCYLELTVDTTGYDQITFYYKVSSEEDFDKFRFYINGGGRIEHSGDSRGWIYRTFPVYDELTTFKWAYEKDSSRSGGDDAVWLDNIVFTLEE